MPINPSSFDNLEVLQIPVASRQRLLEVAGVAVVDFSTDSTEFVRDDLVFVVPKEHEDTPVESGGQPLNVGRFVDSVVNVFIATAFSTIGWGVDRADSVTADGKTVKVTTRLAIAEGTIERVGFRVSILAF